MILVFEFGLTLSLHWVKFRAEIWVEFFAHVRYEFCAEILG